MCTQVDDETAAIYTGNDPLAAAGFESGGAQRHVTLGVRAGGAPGHEFAKFNRTSGGQSTVSLPAVTVVAHG